MDRVHPQHRGLPLFKPTGDDAARKPRISQNQKAAAETLERIFTLLDQPDLGWAKSFMHDPNAVGADMSLLTNPYNLAHSVSGQVHSSVLSRGVDGNACLKVLYVPAMSVGKYSVGIVFSFEARQLVQAERSAPCEAPLVDSMIALSLSHQFNTYSAYGRYLLDTETGAWLIYEWPLENTAEPSVGMMCSIVTRVLGPEGLNRKIDARRVLRISYWSKTERLRAVLDPDRLEEGQLSDSILFCNLVRSSVRDLCEICAGERAAECKDGLVKCSCPIRCETASHPLDLAPQQRSLLSFNGLYSGMRSVASSAVSLPSIFEARPADFQSSRVSLAAGNHEDVLSLGLSKLVLRHSNLPRLVMPLSPHSRGLFIGSSSELCMAASDRGEVAVASDVSSDDAAPGLAAVCGHEAPHIGIVEELDSIGMEQPAFLTSDCTPGEGEDKESSVQEQADSKRIKLQEAEDAIREDRITRESIAARQAEREAKEKARRERNRAFAAKSNLRRKQKNDILKNGLKEGHKRIAALLKRERDLRAQNASLRQKVLAEGHLV